MRNPYAQRETMDPSWFMYVVHPSTLTKRVAIGFSMWFRSDSMKRFAEKQQEKPVRHMAKKQQTVVRGNLHDGGTSE